MQYLNQFYAKVTDDDTVWYCVRESVKDPCLKSKKATRETREHVTPFDPGKRQRAKDYTTLGENSTRNAIIRSTV